MLAIFLDLRPKVEQNIHTHFASNLFAVGCRFNGNIVTANRLYISQAVKIVPRKVTKKYFNLLVVRNKSPLGSYWLFKKDTGKQCLFPGIGKQEHLQSRYGDPSILAFE